MKIGVIFTGGTIGSMVGGNGYITTEKKTGSILLNMYQADIEKIGWENTVDFITKNPYTILSENLSGKELETLIQCVYGLQQEDNIEGIIVTHGTDTLQYTAAVLGYIFAASKIPIVLVSSNYVLDNPKANGFTNFFYGVEFIKGHYGTGVFVSYCNEGEASMIHYGTRLNMPVFYSDDVSSVEKGKYGYFSKGKEGSVPEFHPCYMTKTSSEKLAKDKFMFLERDIPMVRLSETCEQVLQIQPYPGMTYPELSTDIKLILHGSFHSGTIGISQELKVFAKAAMAREIPFYLIGLSSKVTRYETVSFYEKYHIIPLYDTAYIAQYCKAWLAFSNHLPLKETMECCMGMDRVW